MRDINSREDILFVLQKFYEKLLEDSSINYFFTRITTVNQHLDKHIEILVTFWEQSLFMKGGYTNNMFHIHKEVHQKHAFTKTHYDIWLHHFYTTIDAHFEGKVSEQMKTNALSMATVMQIKLP